MEALLQSFFSVAPSGSDQCGLCSLRMRKFFVHCHGSVNLIKFGGCSSVSTKRSTWVLKDLGKASVVYAKRFDSIPIGGQNTSMAKMQESIGIVTFITGRTFFITGATGFLAKALVEKILRMVPEVGKIFLLVRAKNKEAAMDRLKEVIDAELFKNLKQTHGKSYQAFMLSKLVPVLGDVCESNIGLDEESAGMMMEEVDVIVNSAANTTFNERYDVAIDVNTRGPCNIMDFRKKCRQLKLFLQVSTAYANGQRQGRIMEKSFCLGDSIAVENSISEAAPRFQPMMDVENEMKLALNYKQAFEDHVVSRKLKELGLERARTFGWQDSYIFTKAMGEMTIDQMRGKIPVVIIRPSVIESTWKDPFPGWIEGNRMMDPVLLHYGKGLITGFLADPNGVIDVVPADMVVNAIMAAIARHGMAQETGINIYQIASSVGNPLVIENLVRLTHEHYAPFPCKDPNGRPIQVALCKLFSSMDDFSAHLWRDATRRSGLAAMVPSKGKMSPKQEIICRKSVERAKYLAKLYAPYTCYGGRFDNSNTQRLMEGMSEEEKRQFGFDVRSIDWKDYIKNVHIPGIRRHIMKEKWD